jgi:hypothetical protein
MQRVGYVNMFCIYVLQSSRGVRPQAGCYNAVLLLVYDAILIQYEAAGHSVDCVKNGVLKSADRVDGVTSRLCEYLF